MHIWILCNSPWGNLLVGQGIVGSFSAVSNVTWGPECELEWEESVLQNSHWLFQYSLKAKKILHFQSHRNCTTGGREIKPKKCPLLTMIIGYKMLSREHRCSCLGLPKHTMTLNCQDATVSVPDAFSSPEFQERIDVLLWSGSYSIREPNRDWQQS